MRQYPVPTVRVVIENEQNRVLLLRREPTSQGGGQWCLPGGKVDYGEVVGDTVSREIAEETGLTCIASTFLFYQDGLPLNPGGMHCINLVFQCVVAGEITLNAESTEYAWVSASQFSEYDMAFRNDEILVRFFKGVPRVETI